MENEIPTYFPGDLIHLEVEIEHRCNISSVHAWLEGLPEGDEGGFDTSHQITLTTDTVIVRDKAPDGTKSSTVLFNLEASAKDLDSGLIYEIAGMEVLTAGDPAGGSPRGEVVGLDTSGVNSPRFRFEDESVAGPVEVKNIRLNED